MLGRRPPEEAPNQPKLPLEELAVAVGLWQRIFASGQVVEDSPEERTFRAAIELAAEELRAAGADPADVLDRAGVQLTGAHAMRITMGESARS